MLRFPFVAVPRIRSVNRSPLGAASRATQTRYLSFTSVRAISQEQIPEGSQRKMRGSISKIFFTRKDGTNSSGAGFLP
jgi:hypothetical protein